MCVLNLAVAIGRLCEKCDGKWYVALISTAYAEKLISYYAAQFATHMSVQRRLFAYAMNVTSVHTVDGASSVALQVCYYTMLSFAHILTYCFTFR